MLHHMLPLSTQINQTFTYFKLKKLKTSIKEQNKKRIKNKIIK